MKEFEPSLSLYDFEKGYYVCRCAYGFMKGVMQCLSIEIYEMDFLQCSLYKIYEKTLRIWSYREIGYISGNRLFIGK